MDNTGNVHQLHVQARCGNLHKVKRLLEEHKEYLHLTDCMLDTPLHFAAGGLTENNVELVKYLLSKGAKVDTRNIQGKTALHKASRSNSCSIADVLLDHGADVNNRGTTGMTPLHDASLVGSADVAERLIVRGADVNTQDYSGDTPAHMASTYGHTLVLKVLIAHSANLNLQTSEGLTPLHVACYAGDRNLQVIDILLESNADVNIQSQSGDTALHKAVLRSYIHKPNKIHEKLLAKGALIDMMNNKGETPYDFCLIEENDEVEIVIKTALEKHIIALQTAGFTVDISLDTDSEPLKGIKAECVEELNKMKITKVNDLFSLNIVFLNLNKNPWYLKNSDTFQKLEEMFIRADFSKNFPLYGHILKNLFEKAKQKLDILETAVASFNSEKRKIWSKNLPGLVKFLIIDFLNDSDLKSLIESG